MMQPSWARRGDLNAFFGLMLDNVAVMIILFASVASGDPIEQQLRDANIRFTPEFVLTRMIPGTALGVLLGDLVFTWMAIRLARRTGRSDVTAMPLGLDTPSTFGVAFLILVPALQEGFAKHGTHEAAMQFAWHVGLLTLAMVGVFKVACAPFGNAVRRLVPRAGLLGSLAAIALALIAFLPLLLDGIAGVPLVGMMSLLVVLITLVAHRELPGRFPGALAAVLVGVAIFLIGQWTEKTFGVPIAPAEPSVRTSAWNPLAMFSFYSQSGSWWESVFESALAKMPVALPFALATIVGGLDCTESAIAAGDEYDTRAVLLTEAGSSLVAGLLGGVIQTTPYIGHPAYKKMGAGAGYTLATALFIGVVGYFGGFQYLFAYLPRAAMFPILVFVGLEMTAQSFAATKKLHYPAVAFAMLPALAYLALVVVKSVHGPALPDREGGRLVLQTLLCLANGFILTSVLWSAALAMLLDGRLRAAAAYCLLAGVCTFFGVMHSPLADERIDLPWRVLAEIAEKRESMVQALRYQTPYHWAAAYGMMGATLVGLSFAKGNDPGERGV